MNNESPAAQALVALLRALHGPDSAVLGADDAPDSKYRVLSYRSHFAFLWSLLEKPCDQRMIISWDGSAISGSVKNVPVGRFLTPYDWLAGAYSSNRLPPQVTIVDIRDRRGTTEEGQRLFLRLLGSEPALRGRVAHFSLQGFEGTRSLAALMPALIGHEAGVPVQPEMDPETVQRLWSSRLVGEADPSSRHAIANLVGPRILIESMRPCGATDNEPAVAALSILMRSLGLVPSDTKEMAAPWFPRTTWERAVDTWILVDDMYDIGWSDFLKLALEISDGSKLLCCASPHKDKAFDGSKKTLYDMLLDGNSNLFVRSDRPLTDPGAREIVFLDLRLFTQNPAEAWPFYERLIDLARQASDRTDLPWEPIPSTELDAIYKNRDEAGAVTLLPRLLALAYPRMPIVIFSSTGDRKIVSKLQPYGNLIADFDKPRFFGKSSAEIVGECRDRLARALNRALDMAEARELCRQVERLGSPQGETPPHVLEIYVEESGDTGQGGTLFCVGGIVLEYPDDRTPDTLDAEMKQQGIVWGLADGHPPLRGNEAFPNQFLPKYPRDYSGHIRKIEALFKKLSIGVRAFALVLPTSRREGHATKIMDTSSMDNLYRFSLESCLDALLCWLDPHPGKDISVSVDVATRAMNVDPKMKEEYKRCFGITIRPGKNNLEYFHTLSSQEVYPAVARLLLQQPFRDDIDFRRARAVTLYDYADLKRKPTAACTKITNQNDRPRPRQIHYLADWIARFARSLAADPRFTIRVPAEATTWFKNGFLLADGPAFRRLLAASHAARRGDLVEAMCKWAGATEASKPQRGAFYQRMLAEAVTATLRERLPSLPGKGFVEFASRIASPSFRDRISWEAFLEKLRPGTKLEARMTRRVRNGFMADIHKGFEAFLAAKEALARPGQKCDVSVRTAHRETEMITLKLQYELWVSNLPRGATANEVLQWFNRCGAMSVSSINTPQGRGLPFTFVGFPNRSCAISAMNAARDRRDQFRNLTLRVRLANDG